MGPLGLLSPHGVLPRPKSKGKGQSHRKSRIRRSYGATGLPLQAQRGLDQGLRTPYILCFWSLGLGEPFWCRRCQRTCPVGSGMLTWPPPRKQIVQQRTEVYFPLQHVAEL